MMQSIPLLRPILLLLLLTQEEAFLAVLAQPSPPRFVQLAAAPSLLADASAACAGTTCFLNGGFSPNYGWAVNTYSINITASSSDPSSQWDTDYPQCWPIPECGGVGPGAASAITWDTTTTSGHYLLWGSGGTQSSGANEFQTVPYLSYYDPFTGAWEVCAQGMIPLGNPEDMPGVAYHEMISINQTLYLLGGSIYIDVSTNSVSNATLTFDTSFPQASAWGNIPELTMPAPNTMFGAASIGNKIYVVGGSPNWEPPNIGGQCSDAVSPPNGPLDITWELNVVSRIWTVLPFPLQYPRCGLSLLADEVNNKLYAIGGWINSANSGGAKLQNTGIIEMLDLNDVLHKNSTGWVLVHPPLPISTSFMASSQISYAPGTSPNNNNGSISMLIGFLSTGWNGAFEEESNFTWAVYSS